MLSFFYPRNQFIVILSCIFNFIHWFIVLRLIRFFWKIVEGICFLSLWLIFVFYFQWLHNILDWNMFVIFLFILHLPFCFSFFFRYFSNSFFNKTPGAFSNFFNDIRFKWNFLYFNFLNLSITLWLFFVIFFCIFFSSFYCDHLSLNDYWLLLFDSWKFVLFVRIFYMVEFFSFFWFLFRFYLDFDSFLSLLVSNSFHLTFEWQFIPIFILFLMKQNNLWLQKVSILILSQQIKAVKLSLGINSPHNSANCTFRVEHFVFISFRIISD